jgi:molybdate transport system substrate-binding protein
LFLFSTSCSGADPGAPWNLVVFAASSLTAPLEEARPAFLGSRPQTQLTFNFAGSQTLRTQLEGGAYADVYASADQSEIEAAAESSMVLPGVEVEFARNSLTVILAPGNPGHIRSLEDLERPGVRLVIADESVPVGRYARQMLQQWEASRNPGFAERVLANVVSLEQNVSGVTTKVEVGEADAGIVYFSDLFGAAQGFQHLAIPEDVNPRAAYFAAPLSASRRPELAADFVGWLLGEEAQSIFAAHGFLPPAAP